MGRHWIVLIIPLLVGLVTYVAVRLVWKKDKLVIADAGTKSPSVDPAGAKKRLLQAKGRRSPPGTLILLTLGVIGGFSFVWYFLNSHSPLVLMLKHLAAFDK